MKYKFITLFLFAVFCHSAHAGETTDLALETGVPDDLLVGAIDMAIAKLADGYGKKHWLYGSNNSDRKKVAEQILASSKRSVVPPFLVVTVNDFESKFDPSKIGRRGEIGMMQLMRGAATRGCTDLKTPAGQIDCGTKYLRTSIDYCGGSSLIKALSAYASGFCQPKAEVVALMSLRVDSYFRLWREAKTWLSALTAHNTASIVALRAEPTPQTVTRARSIRTEISEYVKNRRAQVLAACLPLDCPNGTRCVLKNNTAVCTSW